VFEWEGVWDEKAKAINWKADLTGGLTGTLRWAFPADNKMELEFKAKLGFVTALTMNGTMTKKTK